MGALTKVCSLFVVVTLLLGCSQDDDVSSIEEIVSYPEILGDWEWVGTTGGAEGTPDDGPNISGITRDILVTDTQFTFYINDEILAVRDYTYAQEISVLTGEEEFIITFSDNGFRDIVRREANFVNFIDDCDECYTSIYRLKD